MAHLLLGTPGRAYFFVKLIANACRFSWIVIHLGRDVSTGQEIRMHLRQVKNKKTGRTYLSIVQSYRGADGKVRSKTLESLGSLDELRRSHDDPVAHFRAVCERRNAEARDAGSPVTIEFPRLEKVDKRGPSPVSVGCAPVLSYMGALGVTSFFKNRSFRRALGYDPCRVLELLVCDRAVDPHPERGAWESRASFPRACGFSLHDVYRCLDYLQANADALVARMNAEVASGRGRDRSGSYYDVTNYYFECDCDEPGGLRQRGCSKEHRPNPIVQMGLLLDGEGIPIGYDLFPGNTNDCLTMMPVLKKAREGGAMGGRTVVVADKGPDTSDDIAARVLDGNGYVFGQSVRRCDSSLRKWALSDDGYGSGDGFKIKSRPGDKAITLRDRAGRVIDVQRVPVRLVAFWGAKYARRAAAERGRVIEKARRMVRSRASHGHARAAGAGRYVRERKVDPETGELARSVVELDEEAVARDAETDGYYCIVTSEEGRTAEEIVGIYRNLWRIEESFRVIKGDLSARPVYVSTDSHIRAHFLICYVALLVVRLMQADMGWRHSAADVREALGGLRPHHMRENWWLNDYRTDLTDEIGSLCGMDLARRVYSRGEIRKVVAQATKFRIRRREAV